MWEYRLSNAIWDFWVLFLEKSIIQNPSPFFSGPFQHYYSQFDMVGIILALFSKILQKLHWGFQSFQAKHTPLESLHWKSQLWSDGSSAPEQWKLTVPPPALLYLHLTWENIFLYTGDRNFQYKTIFPSYQVHGTNRTHWLQFSFFLFSISIWTC